MDINKIQQSYGVSQTSNAAKNAYGDDCLPAAASDNSAADTVQLSTRGKSLSDLPPLMLPTRENVQKLSAALSSDLKKLFGQAGISPQPAVEFEVDSYSGAVSVKGDRPDAQKIAELIKKNPDIERQIHDVAAISSHVVGIAKAMEADKAYRAAQNQAEVNSVVARYASVYSGRTEVTDFSLVFNGADVQVNGDGKPWLSSKA